MKAPDFDYHRPTTRAQALALMSGENVCALAGGQSLMPMMNFQLAAPDSLVDLNAIADMAGIAINGPSLTIGAMTQFGALESSPLITKHASLIDKALSHIAHPAIRNRGTIGGSCALADPAAEMPALMLALGAEIELQSATGSRRIAAADFFRGVYETARHDDELIVALHIPFAAANTQTGFYEIARRHGDYAMAGCAIVADSDLTNVTIALFGVSTKAVRATAAEAVLAGGGDVTEAVATLGDIDFQGDMNADPATKKHLAGIALSRAWTEVIA